MTRATLLFLSLALGVALPGAVRKSSIARVRRSRDIARSRPDRSAHEIESALRHRAAAETTRALSRRQRVAGERVEHLHRRDSRRARLVGRAMAGAADRAAHRLDSTRVGRRGLQQGLRRAGARGIRGVGSPAAAGAFRSSSPTPRMPKFTSTGSIDSPSRSAGARAGRATTTG